MFEANCSEQVGQREKTILDPVFFVASVACSLCLLDSAVWQVFWTLQCGRSFGLYTVEGLLDCTVWAGLLDSSVAGSASRLTAVTG